MAWPIELLSDHRFVARNICLFASYFEDGGQVFQSRGGRNGGRLRAYPKLRLISRGKKGQNYFSVPRHQTIEKNSSDTFFSPWPLATDHWPLSLKHSQNDCAFHRVSLRSSPRRLRDRAAIGAIDRRFFARRNRRRRGTGQRPAGAAGWHWRNGIHKWVPLAPPVPFLGTSQEIAPSDKWLTARKGQFVQVADLVKMSHRLPMCHASVSTSNMLQRQPARRTLAKPVPHCHFSYPTLRF